MRRVSICEKTGLRKGSWAPEEDRLLSSYIKRYGHGNWRELPKCAGLSRCGKSCRLRWMNYLSPNIKRGNFTKEEDDIIVNYFEKFGSRWSVIAATLPGRTDNEIKNRWHTNLKKGIEIERCKMPKRSERKLVKGEKLSTKGNSFNCDSVNIQISESCPIFTPVSSERSCESSMFSSDSAEVIDEFQLYCHLSVMDESYWTELFLVDNDHNATFDSLLGLTFSPHNEIWDSSGASFSMN